MLKKALKLFGFVLLGLVLSMILFILVLRWVNPPFTSFMVQADWNNTNQDFYNLRTYWVSADELPEHLIWAVVASEDQLFFEHSGFDIESIQEAWEERRGGKRTRGASTISQQVAKNLFLSPAQSFFRKGIEAVVTVCLELFWPKERIIEVYLNIAEFAPGIYGIGKASDHYYGMPAGRLTPEMTARFAAVLPSPGRMQVNPPSPYTQERSLWILRQMNQLTGKRFYEFAKNPDREELEDADADLDSTLRDSSGQVLKPDSLTRELIPDTLYLSLPDTIPSASDTTDSTRLD